MTEFPPRAFVDTSNRSVLVPLQLKSNAVADVVVSDVQRQLEALAELITTAGIDPSAADPARMPLEATGD